MTVKVYQNLFGGLEVVTLEIKKITMLVYTAQRNNLYTCHTVDGRLDVLKSSNNFVF